MADELQLQFDVRSPPGAVLEQWRREPPRAFREGPGTFEIADESFNSLTFEARYLDAVWKIFCVLFLGIPYLFRGLLSIESVFRVTARFDEEGAGTRVTLLGKAHPDTRAALGELAAEHGGAVGLRVGA